MSASGPDGADRAGRAHEPSSPAAREGGATRLDLVRLAAVPRVDEARFPRLRAAALRPLVAADAALIRVLGGEANPLHQSGAVAALAFLLMLATGVYLLFLYRVSAPYESMQAIQAQAWAGRWLRALHRYAADAAVIAVALHVLRMWAQGRSWGPRALAWLSGLLLLALLFVSGWTGYVMVWDTHALLLAREGARLLDALPIFAEPLARAFSGERAMPSAFFFLNLFAHVAVPVGMAGLLLVHVARLARPRLLPPRRLAIGVTLALLALAVVAPAPLPPRAEPLSLVREIPLDLFYAFWLPLTRKLSPELSWIVLGGLSLAAMAAPWWTRPRRAARPAPSTVDPERCTGCVQCSLDCPFDAIAMIPRGGPPAREDAVQPHPRPAVFARVDPQRCVACGICAGSCAPMVVGPPGRAGRDQLAAARAFVAAHSPRAEEVVQIGCRHAARCDDPTLPSLEVDCAGNLHTSVVETLLRGGAGGVLIASCSPRDCRGREGPKWLGDRLFREREAELHARVDRRRVRVSHADHPSTLRRDLAQLRAAIAAMSRSVAVSEPPPEPECSAAGEPAP